MVKSKSHVRKITIAGRIAGLSVPLDPAGLAGVAPPPGEPRCHLTIKAVGHELRADVSAKSVRRAVAAVAAAGPDAVLVLVHGRLGRGGLIEEAGLVVHPKCNVGKEKKGYETKPDGAAGDSGDSGATASPG